MFEQSMVVGRGTQKGWTIPVSLALELLMVGGAVAVPLIYTEAMPPAQVARMISPPPAALPRVEQARTTRTIAAAAPAMQAVFRAPSPIPRPIAAIVDEPPAAPAAIASCSNCVAGGTGSLSNMLDGLVGGPAAPAAPKAVETPKPKIAPAPVRVSKGVQEAKLITKVIPPYPRMAVLARISGTVHLVGVIAKDGSIQSLQVIRGPPLLAQAALEAVRQWRYQPTLLNGEVVEVIAPIDFNFTLGQ